MPSLTMPARFAQVIPRPVGESLEEAPQYTGSPWQLFIYDVKLFFRNILYLPLIFLPLAPWPSGPLDELYPSLANTVDILLHSFLFITQLGFLISLPILIHTPLSLFVTYVFGVLLLNYFLCQILNRGIPEDGLKSTTDDHSRHWTKYDDERWIFLNGICVGSGVVFDIIQCLIQRSLLFATPDVRECYILVKKALYQPGVKKVVLILHSQGGIEGGMIVDWLLNEVPQDLLQYLEIYTFGSIANHFNNPYRDAILHTKQSRLLHNGEFTRRTHNRAISHIEHYANSNDFASRFGVLHFTKQIPRNHLENRFMGKVFVNPRSGHQLNQHYLDSIFPLDPTNRFTRDPKEGDFMDLNVFIEDQTPDGKSHEPDENCLVYTKVHSKVQDTNSQEAIQETKLLNLSPVLPSDEIRDWKETSDTRTRPLSQLKTRDVSRLWLYRNGGRHICKGKLSN